MKNIFLTITALSSLFIISSAHAQFAIDASGGVPNGVGIGPSYQINKTFDVNARYNYFYIGDGATLQLKAAFTKKKNIYAFADVSLLKFNSTGRGLITDAINHGVRKAANENPYYRDSFSGYQANANDYKVNDFELGAGLGAKFGIFFFEAGLRTTQVKESFNQKVDVFVNSVQSYANQHDAQMPSAEKDQINEKIQSLRGDLNQEFDKFVKKIPGGLSVLPEIRFGVRIPIGQKTYNKRDRYNRERVSHSSYRYHRR